MFHAPFVTKCPKVLQKCVDGGYNKGMSKNNTKNNAGAPFTPQTTVGEALYYMGPTWRRILWLTAFLIPFVYVMSLSFSELVEGLSILHDNWWQAQTYGMVIGIEVAATVLILLAGFMVATIFATILVFMLKILQLLD